MFGIKKEKKARKNSIFIVKMTMNYDIGNTCGKKRGCIITALPHDSEVKPILSGMHGTRNDIPKILSLANISLDKELDKEGQVEKMAA